MFTTQTSRRNFLKIGVLGLTGLFNTNLIANNIKTNKSIILIWAGGGMSNYEAFNPLPDSIEVYRSIVGTTKTNIPGLNIASCFENLSRVADKYAIIRSFSHNDPGHNGASEFMLTGKDHRLADNGESQLNPSVGSIVSKVKGTNASNGIPSYIKTNYLSYGGAGWLGRQFDPFEPTEESIGDLTLNLDKNRFEDRKILLDRLDRYSELLDSDSIKNINEYQKQSYSILGGSVKEAFNLDDEDNSTKEQYGKNNFGEKLLLARRLVERGSLFVTISQYGWDFHDDILGRTKQATPDFDRGITTLIRDIWERNLQDQAMIIVTTEFSRTGINRNTKPGRDHNPNCIPLLISGGKFFGGQIIGESDSKGYHTKEKPFGPQDLFATCFDFAEIPLDIKMQDRGGRPVYLIENGHPIL